MKSYPIILICAFMIFLNPGCKKKGFDPMSKSQNDFIGTWKGSISTFKNNKLLTEKGDVVIFPDAGGSTLSGIIFMSEISVFHEFQFSNGSLYFRVNCSDPDNPNCQKWSLGGYAVFSEEGKIEIRISGNECATAGNEYVDWNGTLVASQVPSDSLQYYNFAKAGNSWNYKLTKQNFDTCEVLKQISAMPSDYFFQGASTQTCGWANPLMTLKWNVSPCNFTITDDSTFSQKGVSFPIDAKLGVVYRSVSNGDTTTVTLTEKEVVANTPAGVFTCVRFKYTEPVNTGIYKITKTAYIWFNKRYGVIKQEVVNPVDTGDIRTQLLISKNF